MEYPWYICGYAAIRLPDGGHKLTYYNGTVETAQAEINKVARKCGGTAPDLSEADPYLQFLT